MASVSCRTSNGKTSYTCTGGTAGGCSRAIARLKTVDNGAGRAPTVISDFRITDVDPRVGDYVRVGLRNYSSDKYDIIVSELNNDIAEVTVFKGDRLIFRGERPMKFISYITADGAALPFMEALDIEDYVRLDVKDLESRFFKEVS